MIHHGLGEGILFATMCESILHLRLHEDPSTRIGWGRSVVFRGRRFLLLVVGEGGLLQSVGQWLGKRICPRMHTPSLDLSPLLIQSLRICCARFLSVSYSRQVTLNAL